MKGNKHEGKQAWAAAAQRPKAPIQSKQVSDAKLSFPDAPLQAQNRVKTEVL